MHIMRKDVFKFETPITDKPLKIQNGHQQIKNGCHRAIYYNIFFTKNTLKLKFKVVVLVVMVSQI